jgi:nickel/cobalt transporter (NicO) family protein
MMHWLIEIQRWLYGGMWEGMKATADVSGLPAFMGTSFVFGMVHALMPGHGKSVLVSYHLGRPSRLIEGVSTGTLLALTHVGLAAVLVLAEVAVISRSFAQGGRAPAFDVASATLIVLIGMYLVYRTIWPSPHGHHRDGRTLAMATGLVPCPLTTFILTYALVHNKLAVGLAAVIAMLGGVIATLVGFAMAAVVARERFVSALRRSEGMRERLGY